ncbi:caspase family protein [Curvibacter sp. APW13]|uniref:two-partner secretion domain-containing protein n=1 Tax=Curvibacter sp. APW13 TaxID=3077236 RepID=UPI0028DFABE6|nr:caspase family protein [Curvibacter sp. APW13]MDT8991518.1 caspase family protein [Curvibacter sp. APW13]
MRLRSAGVAMVALMCCHLSAQTLPTGMQVVHGQATATTSPNRLNITASDQSVLQWQQFSIGSGNTVNFQLPNSSSRVLNQVTGGNPSQILGTLSSNGQVWLINPNGIVFGANARVDVGGLVASTLYLSSDDFVAGRYRFSALPGNTATVLNQGNITTPYGGRIVLLGHSVSNSGTLRADGGSVALLGTDAVELVDTGTPHMAVRSASLAGLVTNSGAVSSGMVDVHGAAVNQQGSIVADSMGVNAQGEVVLRASGNVALAVGSQTQASGGRITVASDNGTVQVDGTLQASATQGSGGNIRIDARQLFVAGSGQILADAAGVGNGGRIVLWGYDVMSLRGLVSARGGGQGGNGGFVETSTHGLFDLQQVPRLSANAGRGGTWLIDPYDITVTNADANLNGPLPPIPAGQAYSSNGLGPTTVNVATISAALAGGASVLIDTSGPGADAGNIYWNASMTGVVPAGGANLTLLADNNIYLNAPISSSPTLVVQAVAQNNIYLDTRATMTGIDLQVLSGTLSLVGPGATTASNSASVSMTQTLWSAGGSTSSPGPGSSGGGSTGTTDANGLQSKARYSGASGSILDYMPVTGMPGTKVVASNPDMDLPSQPSAAAQLPGYRYIVSDQSNTYFRVIPVSEMTPDDIGKVLQARQEYKRNLLADAVQALTANPGLPDLPGCTSAAESASGKCLLDPLQDSRRPQHTARVTSRDKRSAVPAVPKIARKLALVIGINQYEDARIPQLVGALPDAQAVNEHLQDELGYDVAMLSNPTKAELFASLNALAADMGENDSLMVYYAGHGEMVDATGMGYWIPSDGKADSPKGWVSNSDINKLLARTKSRQMAVIADSCYSGRFTAETKMGDTPTVRSIDDLLQKRAVTMMSSGGDEPVADTGKDGHSVFAWNLMQKIREVAGWSSGTDVFASVRTAVESELPQTPQYGASVVAGHQQGADFIFERRSAKAARSTR